MKKYTILFIINVINYLLLGYFGWIAQSTITLSSLIILALFINYEIKSYKLLVAFIPWLVYHIPFILDYYYNEFVFLISFSFPLFISVILLKQYINNFKLKLSIAVISLIIFYVISLKYQYMVYTKNYYIDVNNRPKVDENSLGITGQLKFEKNTYYLFDCWVSSCGICFKNMPKFTLLQEKLRKENIKFYTFNIPIKGDDKKDIKLILSKYYHNSNNLFSTNKNALDVINKSGYPFTMLIYNNEVVFNFSGVIDYLSSIFKVNLEDMVIENIHSK